MACLFTEPRCATNKTFRSLSDDSGLFFLANNRLTSVQKSNDNLTFKSKVVTARNTLRSIMRVVLACSEAKRKLMRRSLIRQLCAKKTNAMY